MTMSVGPRDSARARRTAVRVSGSRKTGPLNGDQELLGGRRALVGDADQDDEPTDRAKKMTGSR